MTSSGIRRVLSIQAAAALVCFAAELFCHYGLHLGRPYDFPILGLSGDELPDFSLWIGRRFDLFHSAAFFTQGDYRFLYPAPGALFYEVFHPLPHRVFIFGLVLVLAACLAAALFARALIISGMTVAKAVGITVTGCLLSYPLWFELERGNIELYVWLIAALGIWAVYRGKGYSAAACFGIAGSLKIYPICYLGILLARRKVKEIAFGLAVAVLVTAVSLWADCPDMRVAIHGIKAGLALFQLNYVQHYDPVVVGFDHSLFALSKRLFHPTDRGLGHLSIKYTATVGIAALIIFFGRIVKMPLANQVLALTVAMILLPPVSFDYTLLHLYTPLCLILLTVRGLPYVVPSLALAISPLTEFIYHGSTFGGQIRALLLLHLFVLALLWAATYLTHKTFRETIDWSTVEHGTGPRATFTDTDR